MKSYFDWRGDYDLSHTDEYARGLAAQLLHYQSQQLDEQYKNDTYGGDTPEETLRLFIKAIEKKDFNLAAKYYVPERQKEVEKILNSSESSKLRQTVNDYKESEIKVTKLGDSNDYEIRVTPRQSRPPYYIQLMQNTFTGKWKIVAP